MKAREKEVNLTKPVLRSIMLKHPLLWTWSEKDFTVRTGRSGYALYAVTAFHENGARTERRLWVHPDMETARKFNEKLIEVTGLEELRKSLEDVVDRGFDARLRRPLR
jgi:hypothetical protein